MDFAEVSLVALRVFREVAERGTLTSAAAALGYTQSAVSRQVASLERAAGAPLLERRHDGVRPTTAAHVVLRHAATVLDQIDAAARALAGLPDTAGNGPPAPVTRPRAAPLPPPPPAARRRAAGQRARARGRRRAGCRAPPRPRPSPPQAGGSGPGAAGRGNTGASSGPGSRPRSPSRPPASPTP